MEDIKKLINDMHSNQKFNNVKNDLKLLGYLYEDFLKSKSEELVEEMLAVCLHTLDVVVSVNDEIISLKAMNYESDIERSFYQFMIDNGLTQNTAKDYVKRVTQIDSIDKLMETDIDPLIEMYTTGDKKEINKRRHYAPSSALKKFKEFKSQISDENV